MKAVVGEEALSIEEKRFLEFEGDFERKFLSQDPYDNRDIVTSLNMAWDLMEPFPPYELTHLKNVIDSFWQRDDRMAYDLASEREEKKDHH